MGTWGPCHRDGEAFAWGTIEVLSSGTANGKLTLYDASKVSFLAKMDEHHHLLTNFLSDEGEGFQIEGSFLNPHEQGHWESGTLSCGGEWKAERVER